MKLFAFFHGRGAEGARLMRVDARTDGPGQMTNQARTELRERLRELVGKAEQKRQLRNLQTVATIRELVSARETSTDEGDSRWMAA